MRGPRPPAPPPALDPPPWTPFPLDRPKIRAFFPLPPPFSFFFSLWGSSRVFFSLSLSLSSRVFVSLSGDLLVEFWFCFGRTLPSHFTRHFPKSLATNAACYRALVARIAAWRDFRRSHLSEDYTLFSSCKLYFHRLIRTTRRRFWRSWQDGVAHLRMQDACANRIRRCFRLPNCRRAPHASMRWRSSSVGSARTCDHWRTRHRVWRIRRLLPGFLSINHKKVL